jgi:hypothetical protein
LSAADAGLWLAVVASGLYHGVNPAMGWPLAVSAGLMQNSSRALLAALWPLTAGHLLAMLLVMLPFALLVAIVEWQRQIQFGAGLCVIAFGLFRLLDRRHPRALARIRPTQLALWSFAIAIAHGAGLMLVPIYLGLCRPSDADSGHEAAGSLINASLKMAVLVSGHPLHRDGRRRRMRGVAGLPLSRPQLHIAQLVQSGYGLGRQPRSGRRCCIGAQPHRLAVRSTATRTSGPRMTPYTTVIAGLDPAIHPLRKTLVKIDGCAGQARA